jgi:hypothetical protein
VLAGRDHYKYSALEIMMKPGTSVYDTIKYQENGDCFAVCVMAWELATSGHAFPNTEAISNFIVVDMNVLYYNRKRNILSKLCENLAETVHFHRIVKMMGKQLENNPNSIFTLLYYIAK